MPDLVRYRLLRDRSTDGSFTLKGMDLLSLEETADVGVCWDNLTGGQFLATMVDLEGVQQVGALTPMPLSQPFPREQSAIHALYSEGFESAGRAFAKEVLTAAVAQGFAERCDPLARHQP